jgi:lipoprotein-releasing system permease protein
MFGIGIGAMALVCVLSAFNGIEHLVEGMYSNFDPDVRIEAKQGKTFEWDSLPTSEIQSLDGVQYISRSLEETVFLKYRDAQYFATLKGVDDSYLKLTNLDSMLYDGKLVLASEGKSFAILGYGVADQLSVFLSHAFEPLKVYAANRSSKRGSFQEGFHTDVIFPSAIFTANPEYDFKYMLVPYNFAQDLLQRTGHVTSAEVGLSDKSNLKLADKIKAIVGDDYSVKTKFELNELLYQTNKTEKWATFLILSFILLIAAFNLIGSLTVLIIDKNKDIKMLQYLGATIVQVKKLFLFEGLLISIVGGVGGILIGFLLCLAQQHIGLLKLQEGSVVEYYPIQMELFDFLSVFGVVLIIGILASALPAHFVVKRYKV